MKKSCLLLALGVALLLITALSCQLAPGTDTARKSVAVTYSLLGSVVKELVGDEVSVIVSIPNGLDPHDWEPSARDIEIINKADLVVRNGLGLESSLERTLERAHNNGVKIFSATEHISVRHVGPSEGLPSGDPDQAAGAADPHFWMDPAAMINVVEALSGELNRDFNLDVSPQAAVLQGRLTELDREIAGIVSALPVEDRKLVTGHESMGYFAQRYGFKLVGVIVPGLSSQAGISAADLAALKTAIAENHVKAIFTELGTSPSVAKAIGDETGVKVVELTTHALPADGSYFSFMRNIAGVVTQALK
jgi:zinc/manganese transport system substrate-binding protein